MLFGSNKGRPIDDASKLKFLIMLLVLVVAGWAILANVGRNGQTPETDRPEERAMRRLTPEAQELARRRAAQQQYGSETSTGAEAPPRHKDWGQALRDEARDEVAFTPPKEEVPEPADRLDGSILYRIIDVDVINNTVNDPEANSNILADYDVFAHVFSYLRTQPLETLLSQYFEPTDLVGLIGAEQAVYNALNETPQTAATVAEKTGLETEQTRDVLEKLREQDLANHNEQYFRLQPDAPDVRAGTARGEMVRKLLTDSAQSLTDLVRQAREQVESLPKLYRIGQRTPEGLDDTAMAVMNELARRARGRDMTPVTAGDMATALAIDEAAAQQALTALLLEGFVMPVERDTPTRGDVRRILTELQRIGVAQRLYVRGNKEALPVPAHLAAVYAAIRRADQTSRAWLQQHVEDDPQALNRMLTELLGLKLVAKADQPKINELLRNPDLHRGTMISLDGAFARKDMLLEWPDPVWEQAGVRHTRLCFVGEIGSTENIYAVQTMEEIKIPDELKDVQYPRVHVDGMFVKVWTAKTKSGWHMYPMLVAKRLEFPPVPEPSIKPVYYALAAITVLAAVLIFIAARRDSMRAREHKERMLAHQRAGRTRFADLKARRKNAAGAAREEGSGDGNSTESSAESPDNATTTEEPQRSDDEQPDQS